MSNIAKITVSAIALSAVVTVAFAQPGPAPDPSTPVGRGSIAFARGDFAEAERAFEEAVARTPDDAMALAGLARARLNNGQEDQAIELASKALAIAPNNPVAANTLNIAKMRKAAFAPDKFVIKRVDQSPVVIKFVRTDPLPVVSFTIGSKTVNFLIDTGGPNLTLSPALAQELGLPLEAGGQGTFAGGLQAQVRRTVVPKMQIGGIEISNVPAGVIGDGSTPNPFQTDGVIGTGFLMHFLSTLDYCRGELVLAPRTDSAKFQAQAQSAGDNIVRMWLVADHFIFARGHLNQAPEGLFLVDTGLAGAGLAPNKAALDEARIAIDMSNPKTGMGGGGPVQFVDFHASATLGKLTKSDVLGNYIIGNNPLGGMPFKTNGIISHSFFRQSRLSFDFDAMKLVTRTCGA
ncbi:MAG: aspartyl protease family protein [Sphingobium sp.]|nr:aspartyl protease family protein [Sphingobium sp.]